MSLTLNYLFNHFVNQFILKVPNSQGNKHNSPEVRGFCNFPRMIDKETVTCACSSTETQADNTKWIPTLSLYSKSFPSKHAASQGATGSFISNCRKLIFKAQLITLGHAWYWNLCFMDVKSDEIYLWGFWPKYLLLSFAKALCVWCFFCFVLLCFVCVFSHICLNK